MLLFSLILALATYPLARLATPIVFLLLWPEGNVSTPQLPLGVTDKDSEAVRLGVVLPLAFYGVLLPSVLLWMWFFPVSFTGAGFHPDREIESVLRGGFLGLSWAGIWLWLWIVLSAPQRLHREVPGLGASFKLQVVVWLAGAVTEELWRVVGITTLVTSGYSPTFSVVLCSLVFAAGFLDGGLERSALAGLEGGLFGILFLWQGSFLAPFAAHLVVQAVYLWGLGQFSKEEQRPEKLGRRGIRCPGCGAHLSRLQVEMRDVFNCPSCHERLSVSEDYRTMMRWVGILARIGLFVGTLAFFYQQIPESLAMWLAWPITYGACTSGLFLYQRIFPPSLQIGEPHFVTLNLGGREPPNSKDDQDN